MKRRNCKTVTACNVKIGGNNPVSIQSMTNTRTDDESATLKQIGKLVDAGCEIVRLTVPSKDDAKHLAVYKNVFPTLPLVADIHFDYRAALAAIEYGADKIRINPGNIGSPERVKALADAARAKHIPIRIGVNGGSLQKEVLEKYGSPTPEALCESAMIHTRLLEMYDFDDIVISVKSSDVMTNIEAVRLLAQKCDYPLHLGVTEAGTEKLGTVKSAVGIGTLLAEGIGDTIRVSLTDDPVKEVYAAKNILSVLGLRKPPITLISCPTCGRARIDLCSLANEFEKCIDSLNPSRPIKVAIMGCAVNGPGEASEADIGVAGGNGEALLFKNGIVMHKIPEDRIIQTLCEEINRI